MIVIGYSCFTHRPIDLMSTVFSDGPRDRGPIQFIQKTQKMVLNAALRNTQHYMVPIKGKVEQSRENFSPFPYTSVG